jgi:hypothetical protein
MRPASSTRSFLPVLSAVVLLAACPSPPPPPAAQPAPLLLNDAGTPEWLDDVAAQCAKIASCSHAHDTPRLREPAACIDWWVARVRTQTDPVQKCLAGAKNCDQIASCAHGAAGDPRAAAYCTTHHGVLTACDGNAFVSCSGDDLAESTRVDCGAASARCEERKAPGGLVTRGCFSATVCPDKAPEERCEGPQALVSCHDGLVERTTCPPGTRCAPHVEASGDRGATCEPLDEHLHCSEVGARYCAGDRLVECIVHGHFGDARVSDCAELGLRCVGTGTRAACVIRKPLECEPGPARCEGEALAFCAAGRRVKVSCRGLGLGPCDADAQGPAAACEPGK